MIASFTILAGIACAFQACLLLSHAAADATDRLLCLPRPVKGLPAVDYDRFSGDWKEILKTPGPPNVASLSSGVWRIDFSRSTFSYAAVIDNSALCISPIVGRITEEYTTDNVLLEYEYFGHRIEEKVKVAATDYTSYAILYTCAWVVPDVGLCAPEATHVTVLVRHAMDESTSVRILANLRRFCVKRSMLLVQDSNVTCTLDPPVTVSEGGSEVPGTARCFKAKQPGYCKPQLQAFFYNSKTSKCEQFISTGCGVNENHFLTEAECIAVCERPLREAEQTKASIKAPETCDGHCGLTCPPCCTMQDDECITCHCQRDELRAWLAPPSSCIGSSTECPVECQARQNSSGCFECQCQMEDGSLRPAVEYRTTQAEIICPPACELMTSPLGPKCRCVSHDICNLPFIDGQCDSAKLSYFYNKSAARCDVIHGCNSNDNNFDSHEECLAKCSDVCHYPKDTGPCQGQLEERYFYNPQSGQCEAMMYGGCGGNENNFHSLDKCKKQCEDACEQRQDPGTCDAHLKRYYYAQQENECRPFIYGGCMGNGNNFYTEEQCKRRCKGSAQESADYDADRALCHLPLDEGKCDDDTRPETRYFYDAASQECSAFVFAGCGGNDNNFMQLSACNKTCYGSTVHVGPRSSGKCPVVKCSCAKRKRGKDACPACDCSAASGTRHPSILVPSALLLLATVRLLTR